MFSRDKQGWQFVIRQSDHSFGIEFRMAKVANYPVEPDGTLEIAGVTKLELTAKPMEPGALMPVAAILGREEVQNLVDALWEGGFRPTGWGDSAVINEVRDAILKIAEKLGVDLDDDRPVDESDECRHGVPLEYNCSECSDSGDDPRPAE